LSNPVATLAIVLAAQSLASAQQSTPNAKPPESRWEFVMADHPSLRFGDIVRLDLKALLDFEWRGADASARDDAEFGRKRIGIDGRLFSVIAFEVERELGDDDDPWRDVFAEFRQYRALRVRGGRFKIPFGAERIASIRDLGFARRSVVTETLSPGRDTGVELSGRLFGDVLTYLTGVFQHDGSLPPDADDEQWSGRHTVAGRLLVAPFAGSGPRVLRRVDLGLGYTRGQLSEGLHSPALRTTGEYDAFAPMYVAGHRQRLGLDASVTHGPVFVRGEYLRMWDQRHRQGLDGGDLPDLVAGGWYVSGTWMMVGDLRNGASAPRRPLFRGGAGAVQLAARAEALGFHSDPDWDDPFRNPRAANVLGNDYRAWTAGINWYPVRSVKLQFNFVREHLGDPERRPDPARAWSTSRLFRVQFAL
jgi:phosphate-selective porin OprO and OprP